MHVLKNYKVPALCFKNDLVFLGQIGKAGLSEIYDFSILNTYLYGRRGHGASEYTKIVHNPKLCNNLFILVCGRAFALHETYHLVLDLNVCTNIQFYQKILT
jgi:hypothetical protein